MDERTQRPQRARLKDVAERAGVAPATVSRFLNGAITLPQDTAAKIHNAAAELAYRPNPFARSLGRGVSDTIGLALPDLSNPFFGQLASHIEVAARAAGRSVMLAATLNDLDDELRAIDRLERGAFDVLMLATNHADDGVLADAINRNARRVVLLDEDVPGTHVAKVFSDNEQGGRLVGRALADAGHRRVAYIGGPKGVMSAEQRRAGFQDGFNGQVVVVRCTDYVAPCGASATAEALRNDPSLTGVFFGSDTLLLGGLPVLRQTGLRIGRDVSVVSFDDVGPLAFFDPPISAVRHRMDKLASGAIAAALAGMAPKDQLGPSEIRVPVELIIRSSLGPAPHLASPRRSRSNAKMEMRDEF